MVKRPSLAGPPATTGIGWDPSRCRRVIRPLLTKLKALKEDFKPPFTKPAKPRREPTPGADNYEEPVFPPVKRKIRKPVRTYAMGRTTFPGNAATRPLVGAATVSTGKCRVSDYASSLELFEGRPAHWDSEEYYLVKGIPPDSQFLAVELENICSSFAGTTDTRVVRLYQAIYVALDTFLLATAAAPTAGPATPSLAALAARQVAYCILATEDDELVWYDLARGFGKSGEYLRDIVRWHGIELLKDSIAEGLMSSKDGSAGMAGLCIGLCRKHGADREAESLLETLLHFDPTFSTKMSQVMETMRLYFSASPHGFVPPSCVYRILKTNTPSIFSNFPWITSMEIQAVLAMASKDIDAVPGADEMIMKIMDSAFGFLGEDKISECNPRRSPKSKSLAPRRERAEETISEVVKRLVKLTSYGSESKAKTVLIHLAKGFLSQSGDAKARAEQVWGQYWTGLTETKLAAMAYVQQWSCDEKTCTNDCNRNDCFRESISEFRAEIALCLETLCIALEDEGIMSAAEYLYECSRPVLTSTTRAEHRAEMRAINSLIGRLLASISLSSASAHEMMAPPVTPKASSKPKPKVIIYTPRKSLTAEDEKWEGRRYLIGELVLKVADHYQDSAKEFKDEWVKWATKVEEKVIGLKIQPPSQNTFPGHGPGAGPDVAQFKKKSRKGWRYEEGLGIWTLTGYTPGRKKTEAKEEGIAVVIPHTTGRRSWRSKYKEIISLGPGIDSTDTDTGESHQEWQEDSSAHQTSESEVETKVVSPKSHRKSRAILDSLAKFPRRSRRFIESTPVATRADEFSMPHLKENLLPRLSEPHERPFSVLVERYVPSEDDEDGATAIPDSSPMVSRLTRRNNPSPNLHDWESDATAPSLGGAKFVALPSSSAYSSPPASHPSDSEYTDTEPHPPIRVRPSSSRISLNTQEHTQNRARHRHPITTTTNDSVDDDEISTTIESPPSPRRPRRKSYPPRPSIPTPPSPGQSSRRKRRAARRRESGMKRIMVRKRSTADIAREAELSEDELGM